MKRFLFSLIWLVATGLSARAADTLYHNIGTVDCGDAPQIDASVFINDGSFCAETLPGSQFGDNFAIPYGTQNTLSFTNNGLLLSGRGFQLDNVTADGFHHPAANIVNNAGGANGPSTIFGSSVVLLSATNLVNKGLLEVGPFGMIQLSGNNLNLARGGIMVDPVSGGGACVPDDQFSFYITPTNFFPISGLVLDDYWGIDTNSFASDQIVQQRGNNIVVQSPFHRVTNEFSFPFGFSTSVGPLGSPLSFVRTNAVTSSNWIVQAIFVGSSFGRLDSNITTQVKFVNNTYPENAPPNSGFRTAVVELKSVAANAVTGQPITYALYVLDQLPTSTNYTSLTNLSTAVTYRPASFYVDIYPPCSFFGPATSTNTAFTNTLIYNPTYSNAVVAGIYAGYGATLATATAGFSLPTNSPGRVEITANNLDLTHTRIRGENIVTVKTPHLIGSTGLVVDSPNINYNIGSTNGLLSLSGTDLANPQVQRFGGSIQAWSEVWTNQSNVIGPDPNDPTLTVTNVVEIGIHVLIVDAGGIATTAPVLLNDFSVNSTNIVLNDTIDAGASFSIKGDSLTVNGTLRLRASNWASTNVNLKSLTNNGTIFVPDIMELGSGVKPYASVVNKSAGSLSAFAVTIDSDYFQNSGSISAGGFLNINTRTGKLEGGNVSVGNNASISAQDLKMDDYSQSSAALSFSVTNSLSDSGVGANNDLRCNSGFHLLTKPRLGDLFGTTLQTQPSQFQEATHTWSAEDRGPSPVGFSNNVAIGHLVVSAANTSFLTFSGTGSSNGLYVDLLDLRGAALTDLQSVIAINTNLVIYFADAVNVSAETLDGLFADARRPAGRLRWVKDFVGPNSSVDVLLLNGQTVQMNRSLRFSTTIDSDGDGVANANDAYPLDAAAWNASQGTVTSFSNNVSVTGTGVSRSVTLSWTGTPGTVYHLEFTTNLAAPSWQPAMSYTNLAVTNGVITISDKNIPPGESQRYYRMRYGQ
jgi:hypothetical protein